jgi:uncharacterized protein YcgI (DUF1989 family)
MLLMKDAESQRYAIEGRADFIVKAGEAKGVFIAQGQLLRITAREDGAVASMFGFTRDPGEHLSVHHTRVFSNSYLLSLGMRLVTNLRRPIMVLGQDTVGHHDLLMPASTTDYLTQNGYADQQGVVESLQACVAELDLSPGKWPDPINLFMHMNLDRSGRLTPQPSQTRTGDFVTFRVLIDTTFVVSANNTGIVHHDMPGEIGISVAEDLADF